MFSAKNPVAPINPSTKPTPIQLSSSSGSKDMPVQSNAVSQPVIEKVSQPLTQPSAPLKEISITPAKASQPTHTIEEPERSEEYVIEARYVHPRDFLSLFTISSLVTIRQRRVTVTQMMKPARKNNKIFQIGHAVILSAKHSNDSTV